MNATATQPPPWTGEEVPLAKVGRVLDRQYRELRGAAAPAPGQRVARTAAGDRAAEGLVRTRIATLVIVADDRDALAAALDEVRDQPGRHPSRCVGLLTLPPGRGTPVRAFARVARRAGGGPVYDEVVVEAAVPDEYLASVALPLLLPEIPVYTWWLGTPPFGGEALEELLGVSDRLVVDSATFSDPLRGLDRLTRLTAAATRSADGDGGASAVAPAPTDLVWGRLTPWRELLATVFTGARQRAALDRITEVAVTANQPAAGLLLLGWLASRLGWWLTAPAGSGAATDGGRARYRGGDREVVATLVPDGDGRAPLDSIRITAGGDAPDPGRADGGQVTVSVTDQAGVLRATIDPPGRRRSWPVVGGACALSGTQALQGELAVFGRDRVFEEALVAAVAWARGVRGSGR